MASAGCVFLFLGLMSLSHCAPLPCEDLVRPKAQLYPHHLEGRWTLMALSLTHLPYPDTFNQTDGAFITFSSNSSANTVSYIRTIRLNNKCHSHSYNITLEGSTFTYDGWNSSNWTANFVQTSCHDCLIMHLRLEPAKQQQLFLLSRRTAVEQMEIEEFRAQAKCLKMPFNIPFLEVVLGFFSIVILQK
uniref:Apolipoprotein M n=1 Tax=Sphaeramia orbicularis TaxID=375764 RepID=A0A673CY32_9TELE